MEASPARAELAHVSSHAFLAARSPSLSGNWVRLAKSCYTQISACVAGAGKRVYGNLQAGLESSKAWCTDLAFIFGSH